MFTGIVESLGRVLSIAPGRLAVKAEFADVKVGESIAVNGACLSVSRVRAGLVGFDVSPETLQKTTLGSLRRGEAVNLERALRLSDRLGGHLMTGHVDAAGRVVAMRGAAPGKELAVLFPERLRRYLVPKGSVAVEGVSLTIAALHGCRVTVALVPQTLKSTNLAHKRVGDRVNVEVDALARYLR
ncbi:MAG: riboflavin synthase [Elusimicrobia bacterium]|nr:riboflavin synthase [Elusimicrobiota bacterium]